MENTDSTGKNGVIVMENCAQCGAVGKHMACPVCDGRGCISARELADKLGLKDKIDMAEVSADAIAAAVDNRIVECFKEARKTERELASKEIAAVRELAQQEKASVRELARKDVEAAREIAQKDQEAMREKLADMQNKLRELIQQNNAETTKIKQHALEMEAKNKTLEDQLSKRRQQPAAVGRVAEREFAAFVGKEPDFKVGPKLAKHGDYEVTVGNGVQLLVDVKKESAALTLTAMTKLVKDCQARGAAIGVLVADRLEEVHEIFGSERIVMQDGVTILLCSVESFVNDTRFALPYFESLIRAKISGDKALVAALGTALIEVAKLLGDIEDAANGVASGLEKQADALRTTLVAKLCGRVKHVVSEAHQRITDASKNAKAVTEEAA